MPKKYKKELNKKQLKKWNAFLKKEKIRKKKELKIRGQYLAYAENKTKAKKIVSQYKDRGYKKVRAYINYNKHAVSGRDGFFIHGKR